MKNLSKAATVGAAMLLLSKMLGFLREICLAWKFGTSYIVDAYAVAITLPSVLFGVYAYGFSDAYIPAYMRLEKREDQRGFFNNVLTVLACVSVFVAVLVWIWGEEIAGVLTPGFAPQAQTLMKQFVKIMVFLLPVLTVNSILAAHIQTSENFTFLQFCEYIVVNVLIIASILVSDATRPHVIAIGYVVAHLIPTIMLWCHESIRGRLTYSPYINLRDSYFRSLCAMAMPLGASRLVGELNGVIDRGFASLVGEGVTSALSYANKVQLLFYTLTTAVFMMVCYPRINRLFAHEDRDGAMYYIHRAVQIAMYISVPVAGGLLLYSKPLVSMLFERGMFDAESTVLTTECLVFYAIGIPFYALREIGSRALAANLKQRCVLKNTIFAVACNILLNALLVHSMKHKGLALATSISGIITFLLIQIDLHKINLHLVTKNILMDLIKLVAAAAVSLVACGLCNYLLADVLQSFSIIVGVFAAGVTYLALSIFLRLEILVWIYQRLPKRLQIIPILNKNEK